MKQQGSKRVPPAQRLPESYWRMRIEELGTACRTSEPAGEADGIREAFDLLALAPLGCLAGEGMRLCEATLESLLAARAYESAAIALLPECTGYMLSKGINGAHMASVIVPGTAEDNYAFGATASLALIAALMLALSEDQAVLGQVPDRLN
jgi:hypothetical protein